MYISIISGDRAYIDDELDSSAVKSSATTLSADEIASIASVLKQPYESGDVIALFFPATSTINDLYAALGEKPMYADPQDQINSEDSYPENYAGLRGAYVFQARRYAAFVRWAAHIDAEMEKQREFISSSPQFKAAAGSSNLFDYSAQRVSFNFDYYNSGMNWKYWGKHEWSYSAEVNDTIYSFHNFGGRNDCFIIQPNTFVKPTNFAKKKRKRCCIYCRLSDGFLLQTLASRYCLLCVQQCAP